MSRNAAAAHAKSGSAGRERNDAAVAGTPAENEIRPLPGDFKSRLRSAHVTKLFYG